MATKLSSSDAKAVATAAKAGGLSSAQTKAVISNANAGRDMGGTTAAPTPTTGREVTLKSGQKLTGSAAQNYGRSAPVTAPSLDTENATVPGGAESVPPTSAPTTESTIDTITDPVTKQSYSRDTAIPGSVYKPNKYQSALAAATASGIQAPADGGAAKMGLQSFVPQEQDSSAVDAFISQDPAINTLMSGITQLLNPQQQTSSLVQDYKKLYKQSGLDEINEELIDAETVINGTEDDIRNEIQTAGGFGTESQVQAMALARNKSLLKRYNQLVQMKTDATNQLNTLSQLNAQDKQMAQTRLDRQISAMFNMANFRQQALNNVQEQTRWLATTMGADGLYNAYKQDPRQLAFLEKTLGLAQGGLAPIAQQAAEARRLDIAAKQAQINNANRRSTAVVDVGGKKYLIDSQTGATISEIAPGATAAGTMQLAQAKGNIDLINSLSGMKGLAGAVGPNAFSRGSQSAWDTAAKVGTGAAVGATAGATVGAPFLGIGALPGGILGGIVGGIGGLFAGQGSTLSGSKQNFVSSVEQMRSGLTLDALIKAKANGAAFGGLTEGEMGVLANSATRIGSWAVKDSQGNVVGYNANEADFKAELDKINTFAKLDYVLKGGDPASVGIQEMPDGSYWTMGSNGQMIEIR